MIMIRQAGQLFPLSSADYISDDARIFIDECLLYDFALSCDVLAKGMYSYNPKQFVEALQALDDAVEQQVSNDDVPAFVDFLRELRPVQDVIGESPEELISVFHEHYFGGGSFDSEEQFAKYYYEEYNYLDIPSHAYKYIDYELVAMDLFKCGDMYMTANGYVFIL